jgi:hypothetical protein
VRNKLRKHGGNATKLDATVAQQVREFRAAWDLDSTALEMEPDT